MPKIANLAKNYHFFILKLKYLNYYIIDVA